MRALVIQMACTHSAAMAVLKRLGGGYGSDRSVAATAPAAARLPGELRHHDARTIRWIVRRDACRGEMPLFDPD
jgi:hypothetical protein